MVEATTLPPDADAVFALGPGVDIQRSFQNRVVDGAESSEGRERAADRMAAGETGRTPTSTAADCSQSGVSAKLAEHDWRAEAATLG